MNQKSYESSSQDKTIFIAKSIAKKLKGGEVFVLESDLGGGKTTFTGGLMSTIDPNIEVFSPSFTICNEYETDKFKIYHYDFYRLEDPGIVKNELKEVLEDKTNIVIIEWSNSVKDVLPTDRITVTFKVSDENSRILNVTYSDKFKYLFEE